MGLLIAAGRYQNVTMSYITRLYYFVDGPEIPDLAQRCDDFVKKRSPQPWKDLAADPHIRLSLAIGDIVAAVAGLRFGREKVMSKSRETQ